MKVSATTIEEFFTASGSQEADLRQIDRLIVATVPEWSQEQERIYGRNCAQPNSSETKR